MWDGAIHHLDAQALAPISNPIEMDESLRNVVAKLQSDKNYKALFFDAYGDSSISGERVLKCLSQFMLTLVSANAKYDSVKNSKAHFTAQEEKGYMIYKKHCASCHTEPLFSNYTFKSNGLPIDNNLRDSGREKISMKAEDRYLFKVPSLRNLEYSYPYMHDGRLRKLPDVIRYYNHIDINTPYLSAELKQPLNLNADEQVELLSFLITLTDKKFVFNPELTYPKAFPYPTN
jgi:cytochrome c peroxidase